MSGFPVVAAMFGTGLLIPVLAWSPVPERVKVSGQHTMRMVQQHQVEIGRGTGHVLMLTQASGTNRATGASRWMDGAELVSSGTADLVGGSGPHQGYHIEVIGGDTAFVRWTGKVTTVLAEGRPPATSFEGTWTKVGGTGRLKDLAGNGRYTGRFTSPTDYTADWSGEMELPSGYAGGR